MPAAKGIDLLAGALFRNLLAYWDGADVLYNACPPTTMSAMSSQNNWTTYGKNVQIVL
jgi:hypothetical protein